MMKDMFWAQNMIGIAFDVPQNSFAFDTEKYTILDTGSSHMFIPQNYFMPILNTLAASSGDTQIAVEEGIAVASC